jgi:hypothetical protein
MIVTASPVEEICVKTYPGMTSLFDEAAEIMKRADDFTPPGPGAVVTRGRALPTIILEGFKTTIARVKVNGPGFVWDIALQLALDALIRTNSDPDSADPKTRRRVRNELCGHICYGILAYSRTQLNNMEFRALETKDQEWQGRHRKKKKGRERR